VIDYCVCGSVSVEYVERGFRLVTSQINKHPEKNQPLNCGFVLVKCKVAFFSGGVWSSGEYIKSALHI
jgi:hypothetical protein